MISFFRNGARCMHFRVFLEGSHEDLAVLSSDLSRADLYG